jgi:ribosomal protein S18 acetylase RimI-like enzyme
MKLVKPIFLINTRADNLTKALKNSPQAVTVWIRSGKYKDKMPIIRSAIVYEAKSKADATDYTKRFISILTIPKTHTKLSVLKEISVGEIRQLLSYTREDKLVRTQTHDFDRFKSKKTFSTWKARGKTIYTLISRNGKLLGIVWFSRKQFKNYRFTFAIRVYQPARGKKISGKFLETTYLDFKTTHKKPGLWLKTGKNNIRALKLYRRFGFKHIEETTKGEILMILKN